MWLLDYQNHFDYSNVICVCQLKNYFKHQANTTEPLVVNNTTLVIKNVLYLIIYILPYLTVLIVAQPVHNHLIG
jgi:hypothetical protein